MIQSASTPELQTEFFRRIAHKPYFEAVLGTHPLHLFGNHPASGWRSTCCPAPRCWSCAAGRGALRCAARRGSGGGRLRGIDGLSPLSARRHPANRAPLTLPGWQPAAPLTLWELPKGGALPLPPAPPAELVPDKAPSMWPVSRLVFAESDAEADEFYSAACTALAHGVGTCRALLHNGRPVCTVGCYEQSDTESYMAAGVTDPAWQGRGLARYLIVGLANELTAERAVRFACFPALCGFYAQLGFLQIGKIQHYTTDWNTT